MNQSPIPPIACEAQIAGRAMARQFDGYRADWKRSLVQLVTTAVPFLALLWVIATIPRGWYGLALVLAIPAAGLLVRLFIIQHDCGHGSYFKSRLANDALGRCLSVATLTPYGEWKSGHAMHHATSGKLDRRGWGDVETMTVEEYQSAGTMKRLGYRLYRNPFIMVLVGAPINFIVLQRLPKGAALHDRATFLSVILLDLALAVVFGVPMVVFGVGPVLATYLPVMIIASWIGNWLFYVQHQFEDAYWERDKAWNFYSAALSGSSYFDLPPVLQYFSGNIGLHHIHHLCSRIPNYRLQACLDSMPEMRSIARRLTMRDSLSCWRLALWDEQRNRLVGFRDLQV